MQIINLFCEHREHRRGNFSRYYNHDVEWAFVAREHLVRGYACCVVCGGQKYMQRTSAFLKMELKPWLNGWQPTSCPLAVSSVS